VYDAVGSYDVQLRVSGADGVTMIEKPAFIRVEDAGGAGLYAEYFDTINLTGTPIVKTGSNINANWGDGSPLPAIHPDTFSVRWTGLVTPEFSEIYRFFTNTDDGVRLWIDGKLLIDQWVDQAPTEYSATIALKAGQAYDLKMEYYENQGGAVAQLRWWSPSRTKQIVPVSRLSRPDPPNQPPRVLEAAFLSDAAGDRLVFTFHEDVGASLSVEDLTLQRGTNDPYDPAHLALAYDPAARQAVVTFPGLPSQRILHGTYQVTLHASGITDAAGAQLDGNGDNIPGDSFVFSFVQTIGEEGNDLDGDGDIDLADFAVLKFYFGRVGDYPGDVDGNGRVDLTDFGILKANFGKGGAASVPEPSTMALCLAAGAAWLMARRRRRAGTQDGGVA
jgi:hypothetical protein